MTNELREDTSALNPEPFALRYESCETEGECLLESIVPVRKFMPFFVLYIIVSILFVGFPLLVTYWYASHNSGIHG